VPVRLAEALPADIKVCIVADRGFGDHKLYRMLSEELNFDYLIRFRGNIMVTTADGEVRTAGGCRTGRPCPHPTWRAGDRRRLSGRHRAVRAGARDEAGVVPGHKQQRCQRPGADEPVC